MANRNDGPRPIGQGNYTPCVTCSGGGWVRFLKRALIFRSPEVKEAQAGYTCPDCKGHEFWEGPHGGLSVNIKCANPKCGSEFNVCPPYFIERIGQRKDERR